MSLKKTAKEVNLKFAFDDLKAELEQLNRDETLKTNSINIVEELLLKKLARLADKAQEFVNAFEDYNDRTK